MINIKNATPSNPPDCSLSLDSANFSSRVGPGPNGRQSVQANFQPVAPDGKTFSIPRPATMTDAEAASFQVACQAAATAYTSALAAAQATLDAAVAAAYGPFLARAYGFAPQS